MDKLKQAKDSLDSAKQAVETAKQALEKAADSEKEKAQKDLETANANAETAQKALDALQEKKYSQSELEAAINDRVQRAAKQREDEDAKKAEDARLKKLEDDKKHEELAAEQKKRADAAEELLKKIQSDLESEKQSREKALTVISEGVKAELKALKVPDATMELVVRLTPLEQSEWIAKHREELQKSAKGNGNTRLPNADAEGAKTAKRDALIKESERTIYSSL